MVGIDVSAWLQIPPSTKLKIKERKKEKIKLPFKDYG